MKTISIKKSAMWAMENRDSIMRVARNVKVIYSVARLGSRVVTKINLATVYFDAVISVFDAVDKYFDYKRAVEKTKQLQLELSAYKREFENLKAQYEEMLQTEAYMIDMHQKEMDERIKVQREDQKVLKMIYEQTGIHLEMIKTLILDARKNYMYDDEMRSLEKKYHEAIHARMEITLQIIGG